MKTRGAGGGDATGALLPLTTADGSTRAQLPPVARHAHAQPQRTVMPHWKKSVVKKNQNLAKDYSEQTKSVLLSCETEWPSDSLATAITFSFTVSINCFMACTVRLLLCSLPLISYSPVSTPPTAVGLWNVTKNCNGQPLYACGRQFVNFAGWLPDYWRVGPRQIGRLIAQPPCEWIFYDFCNLIQRMWNKLGRLGELRYLFYRVPLMLLFSTHMLYKNNSGN